MTTSDYQAPGMSVANIEDMLAVLRYQKASYSACDTAQKTMIDSAISFVGQAAANWEGRGFWWSQCKGRFTTAYQTITKVARSSNVTTITTTAAHRLVAGCRVRVNGVTLDDFDDDDALVLTADSTTTFTYANTGDDVVEVADTTGTVAGHAYPLRTINSSALQDLNVIQSIKIDDDWVLGYMNRDEYDDWIALFPDGGEPYSYTMWEDITSTYSGGLYIGLKPIPDDEYVLTIPYIRRHSKITSDGSTDTALIVPGDYHHPVYVRGALWVLRHEIEDASSLSQCPEFNSAMATMAAQDPTRNHIDGEGTYPADRRVFVRPNGDVFINKGGLSA